MLNNSGRADFEAAIIRDGMTVEVVLRRRGLPILDHLTQAERKAVETYAAVFEAVASGGVTMPRGSLALGAGGGFSGLSREGRQSQVVDQAAFLRRLSGAIRSRPVLVFGKRKPIKIGPLEFWHSFAVDGLSVRAMLDRFKVNHGPVARAAVVAEIRAMVATVQEAIANGRDPFCH